jgi:metal-responsive CopG/Arc/MetJ family transcriptional regulator
MTMCRRFKGRTVARVIVSMPTDMVAVLDKLLGDQPRHPARGCRSEYVRLAVAEKLGREVMLSQGVPANATSGGHDVLSRAERRELA